LLDSAYDVLNQILGEKVTVRDLKPHASIDVRDLVGECANQPHIYALACRIYVDARDQLRRDEAQLQIVLAEVSDMIRRDPEKYLGSGKATVEAVNSTRDQNELVQQARQVVLDSQKEVDAARVLVDIFDQKRSMLNNEVSLWSAQYYGTNEPGPSRTEKTQRTEEEIAALRKQNIEKSAVS